MLRRRVPDISPEAMATAARAGHPSALRLLSPAERRQVAADAATRLAAVGLPCRRRSGSTSVSVIRAGATSFRLSVRRDAVTVTYVTERGELHRRRHRSAHDAVVAIAVHAGAATAFTV